MVVSEIVDSVGVAENTIVDLEVVQSGPMILTIEAGPVWWKGVDHSIVEPVHYEVSEEVEARWITGWVVQSKSSGELSLLVDEGLLGELGYDFSASDYLPVYNIFEVRVPATATTLDAATVRVKRVVVSTES
jgi:hypothetical protein